MIDIPSISAVVAAIGVIVGVVFAVLELGIWLKRDKQTYSLDSIQLGVARNFKKQRQQS